MSDLRAAYDEWANAQNPPEGECSCGAPMDAHAGGWTLLHHDYHVVAALAASAPDEGPPEGTPPDRADLWEKFTGGEKLAYGLGYRDATFRRAVPEALDVERHGQMCHLAGRIAVLDALTAEAPKRRAGLVANWLADARSEYARLSEPSDD